MSADPREPTTVEKRVKTSVSAPSCRNAGPGQFELRHRWTRNTPWAAAPARVDDPLRDALVVEVGDLLPEVEVLDQRRAALAGLERMLVSGSRTPPAVVSRSPDWAP